MRVCANRMRQSTRNAAIRHGKRVVELVMVVDPTMLCECVFCVRIKFVLSSREFSGMFRYR